MSERHIRQPRACCSSCATQDAQKRWCPHGTKANLASRRCTRHFTQVLRLTWTDSWLRLIVVVAVVAHFVVVVVLCVLVTCSIVRNSVCAYTVTHGAQELHACVSTSRLIQLYSVHAAGLSRNKQCTVFHTLCLPYTIFSPIFQSCIFHPCISVLHFPV